MNYAIALLCFVLPFASAISSNCTGSATYIVFNNCNWTSRTHPTDYPENAMFSELCGTVHNSSYLLFALDGNSTEGVRSIAETGNCSTLRTEIKECELSGGGCPAGGYVNWTCDTSNNAEGVGNGVCTHAGMVTVSEDYPYISMISMVAPSPDWFVGVANFSPCELNNETGESVWMDQSPETPLRLYAYDAGTDDGETFLSEDAASDPRQPITEFIDRSASNIFYNQDDGVLNPLFVALCFTFC